MPLRILLTGFEPFDGAVRNPSGDVALALDGRTVACGEERGAREGTIHGVRLPVLWDRAVDELHRAIDRVAPHIAISMGMAGGAFRVERVASDRRLDRVDNAGRSRGAHEAVEQHFTTLPRDAIERALIDIVGRDHVAESSDAGGFICEHVFFALMEAQRIARSPQLLRAGFIHVPSDAFVPSVLSAALIEDAALAAVSITVADIPRDEADGERHALRPAARRARA